MPDLGVPELLIVAVIVLLLFGPGKAADIGGSLGRSIREVRKATREDDGTPPPAASVPAAPALTMSSSADVVAPGADLAAAMAPAGGGRFCTECGAAIAATTQKFCTGCGTSVAQPVA